MKIALNEQGGEGWTGGITYINNLIKALNYFTDIVDIVTITNKSNQDFHTSTTYTRLEKYRNKSIFDKVINGFSYRYLNIDRKLLLTLKNQDVNVVFPTGIPVSKKMKNIYWIPDFQFVHLPNLYEPSQIQSINKKLRHYFKVADIIVVSSEDAKKDFANFSPEYLDKVKVLRFVAHVPDNLYGNNSAMVKSFYYLPQKFFYLPNQFWAHKNHALVTDALKILKTKGINPVIVCSGLPHDIRNPKFFANFLTSLAESGVREQFIFLGLVPHEHVYDLIRESICVINPSLFEGWSTSVEECKSVGKRMILSDLPVHFEQSPPSSYYFKRDNPKELAEKLEFVWNNIKPGPDELLESRARKELPTRMKQFGKTFLDICSHS